MALDCASTATEAAFSVTQLLATAFNAIKISTQQESLAQIVHLALFLRELEAANLAGISALPATLPLACAPVVHLAHLCPQASVLAVGHLTTTRQAKAPACLAYLPVLFATM